MASVLLRESVARSPKCWGEAGVIYLLSRASTCQSEWQLGEPWRASLLIMSNVDVMSRVPWEGFGTCQSLGGMFAQWLLVPCIVASAYCYNHYFVAKADALALIASMCLEGCKKHRKEPQLTFSNDTCCN